MNIKFAKMHGLGNDFIVIDGINQSLHLKPQEISALSQRNTGIGFDQCLIIEPSNTQGIDFNYRIFNADGQEVGQCGNGARCLALFAKHYGLIQKNTLRVSTKTTQMDLIINADDSISVNMGLPRLNPSDIPLIADSERSEYTLELSKGKIQNIHAISVGNPHALLIVEDLDTAPVHSLGQEISHHKRFPEQVNVGFIQIIDKTHIKLRVYERGCGETLACGSGAVAAAAVCRLYHHVAKTLRVSLPGGDLIVSWPSFEEPIVLTGPATFVYEGVFQSP